MKGRGFLDLPGDYQQLKNSVQWTMIGSGLEWLQPGRPRFHSKQRQNYYHHSETGFESISASYSSLTRNSFRGKENLNTYLHLLVRPRTYWVSLSLHGRAFRHRDNYILVLSTKMLEWTNKTKQTPWSESASELYRPSNSRLSAKLVPTFAHRGWRVVSVTDSYGRNLGLLDPGMRC
jgi:hypothetical protein